MPKQIQKSYTSASQKIKISSKQIQSEPCRGCSHLNTTAFAAGAKEKENDAVPLPDIVRFLFENFKSLHQEDFHCEKVTTKNERTESFLINKSEASKTLVKPPIFFPGEGSSTAEETEEINANNSSEQDDFIAILTYSPSPYKEFRRSMTEMVEVQVRLERSEKVDWDFLEELLFRYLDLNNEKAHRYILRAFVDLVVVLHENDWRFPARRLPRNGGGGGRLLKGEI